MYRCLYISFMHAQPINSDKQHWLHCISKCHEELNLFIVSIAIEFNKSAKGAHKGCSPIAAQTHTHTYSHIHILCNFNKVVGIINGECDCLSLAATKQLQHTQRHTETLLCPLIVWLSCQYAYVAHYYADSCKSNTLLLLMS